MAPPPPYIQKKTLFYTFFPSKGAEDYDKLKKLAHFPVSETPKRMLIEMGPPVVNHPWPILRTLTDEEARSGRIVVPFADVFAHVLPHWSLDRARRLIEGTERVAVTLSDLTGEHPIKYPMTNVFIQKLRNDDFVVSCEALVGGRNLRAGDRVYLAWDSGVKEDGFLLRLAPKDQ